MSTWSGLPLLSRIEHPALVLAGDDDPLTPVANGMLLAHMLPHARLHVFRGEGHLMLMDDDSRSHPTILEFLTAEPLDEADVWQRGSTVDAQELGIALAGKEWQFPPISVVSALIRRRWLSSADNGATASEGAGSNRD